VIVTLVLAAGIVLLASTAFAMIALGIDRWAPSRFVQERHDSALAAIALLPILFATALMPAAPGPITLDEPVPSLATPSAALSGPTLTEQRDAIIHTAAATTAGPAGQTPWQSLPIVKIGLSIWLLGSVLMVARLGADLIALSGLRQRSRSISLPCTITLSHEIRLKRTDEIFAPMLAGFIKPDLLVPTSFIFDDMAGPVLEHEIAHLIRRDAWTAVALRITTSVFWWVAPIYSLIRIIDRSRETLCDSRAATVTQAPHRLAHALLDAAERRHSTPALALAATPDRSSLAARIHHLSSPHATKPRESIMRLSILLPILAATTILIAPKVGAVPEYAADDRAAWDHSDGPTPLFRAARRGRMDDVQRLLTAGEDPNAISRGDGTALMAAVGNSHDDVVEALLTAGADPDIAVRGDGTALIFAARSGDAPLVGALLDANANPNLGVEGDGNPLISASRRGHVGVIQQLLAAGAEVDAAVSGDGNALIGASQSGNGRIVELLLDAGADVNGYVAGDETPLINAAQSGNIQVAEILVDRGADLSLTVEARMRDGEITYRSPLSEAERMNRGEMARWLRERGAEHRPPSD
jgi:ankyrin repeat protein/beta-lactamase regulating signal transducer with metallopeptidase domain